MDQNTDQTISTEIIIPSKPAKKWYRRWWGIILIFLLAITVALAVMFVLRVRLYVNAYKTGDFSIFNGEIVDVRQLASAKAPARSQIENTTSPSFGANNAKLTVVEFSEFGCPFSKQTLPAFNKMRQEYQDRVKFIFRDFPVTELHPEAMMAALAARCANEQDAFWPYHDLLFSRQGQYQTTDQLVGYAGEIGLNATQFKSCLDESKYQNEVVADFQAGVSLGIQGTPTFYFNGQPVSGVLSEDTFRQIIEKFLAKS